VLNIAGELLALAHEYDEINDVGLLLSEIEGKIMPELKERIASIDFKVGDRVRVIAGDNYFLFNGDICEVEDVYVHSLKIVGYEVWYDKTRFELLPESPKFKVGDRVRFLEEFRPSCVVEGAIFTVKNINCDHVYLENSTGGWFPERFELVSEESKFKVGDFVTVDEKYINDNFNKYSKSTRDYLMFAVGEIHSTSENPEKICVKFWSRNPGTHIKFIYMDINKLNKFEYVPEKEEVVEKPKTLEIPLALAEDLIDFATELKNQRDYNRMC
jgi:hypothetical protein